MLQPSSNGRANNFGFLRLVFALLVVVSHSPELVDGDRHRELLTSIFGTLSFGELAVDGFFLISGFLITKSFVTNSEPISYLCRRVLRIVPAYLVSFWFCIVVVAPFAGCKNDRSDFQVLTQQLFRNVMLLPPDVAGCFHTLRYPVLNGSMWTISYEFSCYLLTAIFGLVGLYRFQNLRFIVALTTLIALLHVLDCSGGFAITGAFIPGNGQAITRFVSIYLVGALFYLFGENLRLTGKRALLSLGLLLAMLFNVDLAETAMMTLGAYVLFWIALRAPIVPFSRFSGVDVSYGLYLYAWPIQSLLIRSDSHINPWTLCAISIVLSGCAGYLSWVLVEEPALRLIGTVPRYLGAFATRRMN